MTCPIIERILADVIQTLQSITPETAIPGLGSQLYQIGPLTVERPAHGTGTAMVNNRVLVMQDDPQVASETAYGSQETAEWFWPVVIEYQAVESEASTTPIDTRLNIAWADLVAALRADYRRGNLAIDTLIDPPNFSPYNPTSHSGWVKCNLTIHFRTLIHDPYTVG